VFEESRLTAKMFKERRILRICADSPIHVLHNGGKGTSPITSICMHLSRYSDIAPILILLGFGTIYVRGLYDAHNQGSKMFCLPLTFFQAGPESNLIIASFSGDQIQLFLLITICSLY
jgi:hypothetical protein